MSQTEAVVDQFELRSCRINFDHWYAVATSAEITNRPVGVRLWKRAIALYRNQKGIIQAIENRCPHRQVRLSDGRVVGDLIQCAYHGWCFNGQGKCVSVPYLSTKQKLPDCQIRSYPVKEQDGFVWLYPGELEQLTQKDRQPLRLPEWDHLNYIATVSTIDCPAHYSFLIENLMDMYHGHLHQDYQAWAQASLTKLKRSPQRVDALYQAQSYYRIDKIWSIGQLFLPRMRRLHPEPLEVSYIYPHWMSTLGEDFKIYCLFCPVNETFTRAYLVHFTSLEAFWRLHKLPVWFRRWIKNRLFGSAQTMLNGLVNQDLQMIQQEQQAYTTHSERNYELNPAVTAVQKLIRQQLETK